MKGNRNDGMGLAQAEKKIRGLWEYFINMNPRYKDTYYDTEFRRITKQMKKRVKIERSKNER